MKDKSTQASNILYLDFYQKPKKEFEIQKKTTTKKLLYIKKKLLPHFIEYTLIKVIGKNKWKRIKKTKLY